MQISKVDGAVAVWASEEVDGAPAPVVVEPAVASIFCFHPSFRYRRTSSEIAADEKHGSTHQY
jgi:hypothetical protein